MHDRSAVILVAWLLLPPSATAAQTTDISLGDLVLTVSDSSTAQLFHIVDQLSEWDPYAHKQYGRWSARTLALSDADRRLLQQHADLRRGRGWGMGFEQAFLVDAPVDRAAEDAVRAGWLPENEAAAERAILEHFAPKLAPLLADRAGHLIAFRARLVEERDRLLPLVRQLSRFSQAAAPLTVPVFLVSNPDDQNGGGEANGGRIGIRSSAASAGVEFTALNEGIAYALAPGLTDDGPNDPLADQLARFVRGRTAPTDAYVQSYTIAAVIRPLLRESLERGDVIGTFLPRAVARWKEIAPR